MTNWERDNWAYCDGAVHYRDLPPPIRPILEEPPTTNLPTEDTEEVLCEDELDVTSPQHITMLQVAGWLTLATVGFLVVSLVAALFL